jgi:sugar transferase (PEP-CTERM system associated)
MLFESLQGQVLIKIFNHFFHRRTLVQLFLDVSVILLAFMATLVAVTGMDVVSDDQLRKGLGRGLLMAVGFVAINATLGFYDSSNAVSATRVWARALVSFLTMGALVVAVLLLLPLEAFYGRSWAVVIVMLATSVLLLYQVLGSALLPRALPRSRALIYGTGAQALAVAEVMKSPASHTELVGYFASPNETEHQVSQWDVLAPQQSLLNLVMAKRIDEIVVALTERRGGSMPMRELLDCKLAGVRVKDAATYFEHNTGQIRLGSMSAGWLIFGEGFEQGIWRSGTKRVFDVVSALVLILLSAPIMLLTALLIKLESKGPVFYRQERVGQSGEVFNVVKFRSMRTDAEKDGVPRWATAGDSRVTRVGRVIRKIRVDELPQLFGVLAGHMSMVGPRPERPYFVDQLVQEIPFYAVRHSVKPGVTGWAQVSYQYGSTKEDTVQKLQYDLYYVKNHSLFLDLVILFQTVGVVLTGKGAQ